MHLNQDPTNVAAKGASSAELSRWRDEQVDPQLLIRPDTCPVPEKIPTPADVARFLTTQKPTATFVSPPAENVDGLNNLTRRANIAERVAGHSLIFTGFTRPEKKD